MDVTQQEIRFCTAEDGARLAYAKSGHGLPLVKTGTWLTHLEHDWNSPIWRPWMDGLSRHHTLYRYDPRGCGLSDWTVDNFSIDTFINDLETVVNAAGLKQFALMGTSQGGCLALLYAARYPEKVSHLIICGGYLRGMYYRDRGGLAKEESDVFLKLLKIAWASDSPAYRQVFSTELLPEGTSEQIGWLNELQRLSTSPENAVSFQKVYNEINLPEVATQIRAPTLILHAKHDAGVPFEEGRLVAAHISDARFVPLDSQNHILLPTERAWGQFWREFYGFFGIHEDTYQLPSTEDTDADLLASIAQLTLREREILHLLAQGYRNEEIAQTLVLTSKTVRNYVSRIYDKLNITSRGELIVMARKAGFDTHQ